MENIKISKKAHSSTAHYRVQVICEPMNNEGKLLILVQY